MKMKNDQDNPIYNKFIRLPIGKIYPWEKYS